MNNKTIMQKITPHLWFDKEAKEATAFYATLFPDSKVNSVQTLTGTPSGDNDIVSFTLSGKDFMAISAGPYFKFNPAISLFVTCDTEEEIDTLWGKLSEGGSVMMEFQKYPFSAKYGWLADKYGVSWQLSLAPDAKVEKIRPCLMFTQQGAGKAEGAMNFYTGIFPNSSIDFIARYEEGESPIDKPGTVKHATFTLNGQGFIAMESAMKEHTFIFNEAISFMVSCDTQEEIDEYWGKLSAVPEAEQCGWCKDKYGVSWQIVPTAMEQMMGSGDKEKIARVTQAFLKMKKFDIAELERAYAGE